MKEWWRKLLTWQSRFGLNKAHIKGVIKSPKLELREGFVEMEDFLEKNKIPLVVMSSSGPGRRSNIFIPWKSGRQAREHTCHQHFVQTGIKMAARFP
jgi:hypothetical protein